MIKKLFLILFNLPFLLFSQVENGNYQADSYEIRKWNNATQKYVLDAEEDYAVLLEFQDDYLIINYDENTPYFFLGNMTVMMMKIILINILAQINLGVA